MSLSQSFDFAAHREWAFEDCCDLTRFPAVTAAWKRSQSIHQQIRRCLEDARLPATIATLYISGSLGRMEAVESSDTDLIVILHDDFRHDVAESQAAFDAVWNAVEPLGMPLPKRDGIFASPSTAADLCDAENVGRVDEDTSTFGKRIQLLLDSQPVYGVSEYERLTRAVLQRYAVTTDRSGEPGTRSYLLDDLVRYHRSLCVRTQWSNRDRPEVWRKLNLKLRFSRLLNYSGLLFLLGEFSGQCSTDPDWLPVHLKLTPLERVACVFRAAGSDSFSDVAACYDAFLEEQQNKAMGTSLGSASGSRRPDQIDAMAGRFRSTLFEFVRQRGNEWSDSFFEQLIF